MRIPILLLGCIVLAVSAVAAERPTDDRLYALAKDYANRINPTLDPERLSFDINRLVVPGLWEQMGAEVMDVGWLIDGHWFSGYIGIYRDGKLSVLATKLGPQGFMSGVVSKGAFYFTYSWGAETHRSHVGKLEIVDGKYVISDSGGFSGLDLFVSAKADDIVHVFSGTYHDVNDWKDPREMGTVRQESPVRLGIIDPSGKRIEPAFPP